MQTTRSREVLDEISWPWFVGGFLAFAGHRALSGQLPPFLAAGLSFFVCFTVASFLVSRSSGTQRRRLGRNVLASAAGGVVLAALTYAFP